MSSVSAPEVTEPVSAVEGAPLLPAASPAPPVRGRRLVGRKAATAAAASSADSAPSASPIPADASTTELAVKAAAPRRFIGGVKQLVPDSVLHDPVLNAAIAALPANYNFEIHKCVWRLREAGARCIGLQFPEGLLMYACMISDIIERHVPGATTFIMGDVTYGACCVDDFTAKALGADFMIHFGHSCLVPIDTTGLPTMYVFVEIGIDVAHLVASIRANFPADGGYRRLALAGTVQFTTAVHAARTQLLEQDGGYAAIIVPQAKPLSPGEVLGCTSPQFAAGGGADAPDAVVFVADGRFHLESIMIHNPQLAAFKYDPYSKKLTSEAYDTPQMLAIRRAAVDTARAAVKFGLILGTLGRQGSAHIMQRLEDLLRATGRSFTVVCLSEITPAKLARFDASVECWIQVACPRLSTDWGYAFARPLLTPYEAMVALGHTEWRDVYPMDYYASDGGDWTNYAHKRKK